MALEYIFLWRNNRGDLGHVYRNSFKAIQEVVAEHVSGGEYQFVSLIEVDGLSVETYEYEDVILE